MRADDTVHSTQPTLTDILRVKLKGLIEPIAAFVNRLGISPNTVTMIGLVGNFVGAMFLAQGDFLVGGLILLIMGPMDALDGTMARLRGEASEFGAFVDSVADRYIEMLILGGLLIHYSTQADFIMVGFIFAAAIGSFMVSYVRARAEGLGYQAKNGILTRAERFVVLIPSLILNYPSIGIGVVAILANLTALQRIYSVHRQAYKR